MRRYRFPRLGCRMLWRRGVRWCWLHWRRRLTGLVVGDVHLEEPIALKLSNERLIIDLKGFVFLEGSVLPFQLLLVVSFLAFPSHFSFHCLLRWVKGQGGWYPLASQTGSLDKVDESQRPPS